MRLLVCGSRDWNDHKFIYQALDILHKETPVNLVIHGAAKGADEYGRRWAFINKVQDLPFPANWKEYGNSAGPLRNRQMLTEGKPTQVFAFQLNKSRGTQDMINIARDAGIPVAVFHA
jgi:hypothetical protein